MHPVVANTVGVLLPHSYPRLRAAGSRIRIRDFRLS